VSVLSSTKMVIPRINVQRISHSLPAGWELTKVANHVDFLFKS
jgi:hypothetical protein